MDRQTDRPTNQPTNERTKWGEELHSLRPKTAIRLNFEGLFKRYQSYRQFCLFLQRWNKATDGRTNQQTDKQTLIKMRRRIQTP